MLNLGQLCYDQVGAIQQDRLLRGTCLTTSANGIRDNDWMSGEFRSSVYEGPFNGKAPTFCIAFVRKASHTSHAVTLKGLARAATFFDG